MSGQVKPIVEQYAIKVSFAMWPAPFFPKNGWDLKEAKDAFEGKRKCVPEYRRKVEIDTAMALLEYAESCNAFLIEISFKYEKAYINLGFDTIEDMIKFRDTMKEVFNDK